MGSEKKRKIEAEALNRVQGLSRGEICRAPSGIIKITRTGNGYTVYNRALKEFRYYASPQDVALILRNWS